MTTEEQIKEKAKDFVSKRASGTSQEMDYYANILVEFATEVTKELEKENAELKADNDARKFAMAMSEKVEKQLREENAELKAQLESERDLPAIAYMQGAEKQKKKDEEQFTKAKEIITELLKYTDTEAVEMIKEAEQFLKGQSSTEPSNECHDCAKFDEMPKGPRCKTCDNGSRFQKKEEA